MKENIKSLYKNRYIKSIILIIIGLFIIQQVYSVYIDLYNFGQFKKAKVLLDKIPKDAKKFYTLKEFNKIYNMKIQPKNNCYYVSNKNGNESYIFGFELSSILFKIIYLGSNYSYPKYDLGFKQVCLGLGRNGKCYDNNLDIFIKTISNPCKD